MNSKELKHENWKSLQYGFTVYFHIEVRKAPLELLTLVKTINKYAENPFDTYSFMKKETATAERFEKISARNIGKIINKIKDDRFYSIIIENRSKNQFKEKNQNIGLSFHLDLSPKFEKPQNLSINFIDANLAFKINEIVSESLLKNFEYGFITFHNNLADYMRQATLSPITYFDIDRGLVETPYEKKLNDEVRFYQINQNRVCKNIFKAYWGNFLNKHHLARLGGIEKVKNEAPVAIVKSVSNGAYLQLTNYEINLNNYFGTTRYVNDLKKLNEYLKPLRIEGAPESIY